MVNSRGQSFVLKKVTKHLSLFKITENMAWLFTGKWSISLSLSLSLSLMVDCVITHTVCLIYLCVSYKHDVPWYHLFIRTFSLHFTICIISRWWLKVDKYLWQKTKKKVDRYHNSNGSGARDFCPNFMGCFVQ